ncbi:MAG: class I SAM-dependent methyltransferase [Gammaproteobacteria bacterium]
MAKKDKRGKRRKNRKKAGPSMAELADRHELYEASVQSVENEVEFLETAFTALTGRKPRHLREDFCGTAAAACEWVRSNRRHTAVGVDIDPEVLESWWTFRTREKLLRYFRAVRRSLATDGVFFLDIYGGSDAYAESEEETDYDEFTYVWDQHRFDPLTADYTCYIHFRFPDGSELHRAFGYQWRLWTLPELRELLAEAGFAKSVVYWQTSDEDGEHTGEFEPVTSGDADPAWITYVAACKAG